MNTYQQRRKKYQDAMKDNSMAFLYSGDEAESSHDECFAFEVYRNFYYLTGVDTPKAIYLVFKVAGVVSETLLMHTPTEHEQRWSGIKFDIDELKEKTGISAIRPLEDWEDVVSRGLFGSGVKDCYMDMARWRMSYPYNGEQKLAHQLLKAYPYLTMHNSYETVAQMRTVKTPEEIAAHRKACLITEQAVKNMLDNIKPGMMEYEVEAYYDFVLKSNEVMTPAFPTIAAGGINACYMHYMRNNSRLADGDMILFDLGARWDYYCADVSRTYPVNGKFTARQKELYNVVLAGLNAALEATKPGQPKDELQNISKQVMAQELMKLKMIETPEEISKYYFHGSGHFIGLDTHDVGANGMTLAKDMVFTLEPGLYFDDEKIGIRIEDTILITEDGKEVLSGGIPKTVEEIEAYMSRRKG
ncbi:MAG: M24 family metallopeptidase [Eubacteriaceae bacterium]|nr:M24 family metallopeptidase [Eubacteriaceae bacterium]